MEQYSRIRLLTDKYKEEGVSSGDFGYIIEVYGDGNYEVEFSDGNTGITIAQIVASDEDMELAE